MAEKVYLIDTMAVGQSQSVGAYLIKAKKTTLVDCGYASSYTHVLKGLSEAGVSPEEVRYVIPTHVHLDHAGATGHLIREMPNAEVVAQERAVPHLVDPTRLMQSATAVFGEEIIKMYGIPRSVPRERITPVINEMHIDLGEGLGITLTYSPGHAPHQISVMLDGSGLMMTADAVGIVYPGLKALIPTTPPPSLDPVMLESTVHKLEQFDPKTLLVPHFGPRSDVDFVFEETVGKVKKWVDEVGSLRSQGLGLDQIANRMTEEVLNESGAGELPIYAKISIRTSVMGIIHYLEKKA